MPSSTVPESRLYAGPVIDTFFHSPWMGTDDDDDCPRADRVEWLADPRLKRVMAAFNHGDDGAQKASLDQRAILGEMDRAGVTHALLAAKVYYPAPEQGVRVLHDQLSSLAAGSAGRLKVIGTVVPPELGAGTYWDFMQNVRLLEETYEHHAFVGVHITPSPWGLPPNHKWYYPLYAKCVEMGLVLFTYVGMPGPLWPMVPNDPIHLDEVALAFPDLTIVAHHIGDPWTDMVVRLAAHHPNVYICTSAWRPKRYPPALMEFMSGRWHGVFGSDRVLFASDYPLLDLERTVSDARALNLSQEQRQAALFTNAQRLFWPETIEVK